MKKIRLVFILSLILLASCAHMPETDEEKVYEILQQTAVMHITETFNALPTLTPTATATETEVPTEIPTEVPTSTPLPVIPEGESMIIRSGEPAAPTATVYFPDHAEFVSALPSPNQFVPNQKFNVTWVLKNTGTTTWSGKYRFYHTDGPQLADQSEYAINTEVKPGESLSIVMPATAPGTEGTYQSVWSLQNPDGIVFYNIYYVSIVGDKTFITALPGEEMTATPSGFWWMCTDPDRSNIMGAGCADYCNKEVVSELAQEGKSCYSYGEIVK